MKKIRVALREKSYTILIGNGLLKRCGAYIARERLGTDAVVITNNRLLRLYRRDLVQSLGRSNLSVRFETVPDSEKAKSFLVAAKLINRITRYGKGKNIVLVAFGGGVIGDLTGFVAAVYKRGVPYVQIPTTLLAQVDSSIGGKVAIDTVFAKNMVGTFYQPRLVIADVALLASLSRRQITNGLAEVIKYGVIRDRQFFSFLERNLDRIFALEMKTLTAIVARCAAIKASVVERDEFDKKGIRAILNFGHTIGHAVEAASGYSGRYGHGDAVAVGMAAATEIARSLHRISDTDAARVDALLRRSELPTHVTGLKAAALYDAHLHDKKFSGSVNRLILPTRIGRVAVVQNVPEQFIRAALRQILTR